MSQTGYEGVKSFDLGGKECGLVNVKRITVRRRKKSKGGDEWLYRRDRRMHPELANVEISGTRREGQGQGWCRV
jgi:hypothetical protein